MADTSALSLPFNPDEEWGQIVDRLLDEFDDQDHLPDKVVQAAEMMLAGYPNYKIASRLGVSTATVRRWLSTYPTMAAIVAHGQKLLSKWRMSRLEQQFLTAVERSQEILEVNLDGTNRYGDRVDPKVLTVVAAQARYIIGLFAGQQMTVRVTHELGDTVLKAKEDALSYLAQQLAAQRSGADLEPVEAVYTVVDEKLDNQGPMLDEAGNPPFGALGALDKDEDGTRCHICGGRYRSLARHLLSRHNLNTADYEQFYLLPEGAVRGADGYWEAPDGREPA